MIGLFGGTFDPIHLGHLHAARTLCDALALERVRLLLSARPGHRDAPGASIADRWAMLELACADDPRLVADDTEIRRAQRVGRPSYTVETLEQIRGEAGTTPLLWAVGSDAYQKLTTWHRWRELLELCHLVVFKRPGSALTLTGELAALTVERQLVFTVGAPPAVLAQSPAGRVVLLEAPMRDVSATRIRALLARAPDAHARAESLRDLIPPAVYTYITSHGLYGVISDP